MSGGGLPGGAMRRSSARQRFLVLFHRLYLTYIQMSSYFIWGLPFAMQQMRLNAARNSVRYGGLADDQEQPLNVALSRRAFQSML